MTDTDFSVCGDSQMTALLLCGGRGERLRPLTDAIPKPLLPINGRPMLDHLLEHLAQCGVKDFALCVGYKAELFEQFARERAPGLGRIRCLDSGDAAMTERLAAARPLVTGRALVCYADTLADVDIKKLIAVHETSGAEATITVHPYRSAFGIVTFDGTGRVTAFEEKPHLPYWINIGFLLLEPAALERVRADVPLPDFLAELAARRTLGVHLHQGRHWTANTEFELRELAIQLRQHNQKEQHEIA